MNAFTVRLARRLNEYKGSPRETKVDWFRTIHRLNPSEYRLEYKGDHLRLLKMVANPLDPENRHWQIVDSTEDLPLSEEEVASIN